MQDENPVAANQPQSSRSNLNIVLTIINVVLLIALVILYFIILKPGSSVSDKVIHKASGGTLSVAYVNSDTLLAHYDLVKQMRDELQKSTATYENELQRKQSTFEKDAAYFQEQVNKKSISEASAQEVYSSLMAEQQKLYELREKYSAEIARKEFDMNQLLLDSLNNFLERYNRKMNFDYILSYNKGGSILNANDSLNITNDVLIELNNEYKQKKD
jgi:outer membrane protein